MRHLFGTRKRSVRPSFSGDRNAVRLRQRLLSLFCLLLIALASTAQAVHVHGSGLTRRSAQVTRQQVGTVTLDEAVCPLCVAMHSALPVEARYPLALLRELTAETPSWHLAFVAEPEHFAGFSRPPPAATVLLG